jgi:acyl carrier protein
VTSADTTAEAVLAKLQRGYDVVKPKAPRTLGRDDDVAEDLELDSLDFIDLVSVLEDDFDTETIDAVIDRVPDLRTVGDVVDCFVAIAAGEEPPAPTPAAPTPAGPTSPATATPAGGTAAAAAP